MQTDLNERTLILGEAKLLSSKSYSWTMGVPPNILTFFFANSSAWLRISKIETLSEVFIFLCLVEIYEVKINICSMIEFHVNAPPFFLQISTKSSTVSSMDCR